MTDIELEIRDSFERVFPVPVVASDWEDVLGRARAARKGRRVLERSRLPRGRRRRLVFAFAVAVLVVVVGTATALGVRTFILDRGFVGLPPEGATSSAPESGKLVLSLVGRSISDRSLTQVWLYADGRLIWARDNPAVTGLLEQRLTHEGVERLLSEALSTGLFDHDLALASTRLNWGEIEARVDDRLVRVEWQNPGTDVPDGAVWAAATPEQDRGLERLDALLRSPEAGLSATAWEDKRIRAYVPSKFAVCYEGWPAEVSDPQSPPSRILSLLPPDARTILRGKETVRRKGQRGWAGGPYYPSVRDCAMVPTVEARALAKALDDAGIQRTDPAHGLAYSFAIPGPIRETGEVQFESLLPDGQWTNFRTG